jgi:hypothetical protein
MTAVNKYTIRLGTCKSLWNNIDNQVRYSAMKTAAAYFYKKLQIFGSILLQKSLEI